jgi:hypothetical protein
MHADNSRANKKVGPLRIAGRILGFLAAVSASASAAILDFTNTAGAGAPGTLSGSFSDTNYDLSAVGGSISFNGFQDGSTCATLACTGDGLGIGDDEVSIGQVLRIDFDDALTIDRVFFLDLFTSVDGAEMELARVAFAGGSVDIFANPAERPVGDSGFLAYVFASPITTDFLEFTAPDLALINDRLGVNDFALAGISSVPLPAALPLFGTGLGLMALLGWRRRRTAAS